MHEKIDAIISELGFQRMMMGDRAAALAGELAAVKKELEETKKRLAELEPKDKV